MNILVAALSIFLLRLLDQTLGTLRVLYVNKGKPVFGAVLGFVESAIWVVAISRVIQDLNIIDFWLCTWVCIRNNYGILH